MPVDLFQKYNVSSTPVQEDIPQTSAQPVDLFKQNNVNLPTQEGSISKMADLVNSVGAGVAQNISDLGQAAIWGAHKALNLVPGVKQFIDPVAEKILEEAKPLVKKGLAEIPKFAENLPTSQLEDSLLQRFQHNLPTLAQRIKAPGAGAADPIAEDVGEYLEPLQYMVPGLEEGDILTSAAGAAKKLGTRVLSGAATTGAYGAALTPGARETGGLTGMAIGGALSGLLGLPAATTEGIMRGIAKRAEQSSSKIRSPKEVEKIVNDLTGNQVKNLNFGDLVSHPKLSQFFHDTLANVPFSGARTHGANVLAGSRDLAQNIFNKLKNGVPLSNVNNHLNDTIKNINKNVRETSSNMYKSLENIAKSRKIMILPSETRKIAVKYLRKHYNKKLAFTLKGDVLRLLSQAALKFPNIAEKAGTKINFNDLLENQQEYGKVAYEQLESKNDRMSSIMNELKLAAKNDLIEGAKKTRDNDLINALGKANKFYEENVAPFKSGSIRELLQTDMPKSDVSSVLLSGENKKIIKHFTPIGKKLIGLQEMKKGIQPEVLESEFANPKKLEKYYDLLKDHKDLLFDPETQNQFEQLRALNEASTEPALQEKKSATGYRQVGRVLRLLPTFLAGGATFAPGMRAPLILGALGLMGGARGATKALTSKWLRDAYTKKELPAALRLSTGKQITPKIATLLAAQNLRNRNKQ